MALLGRSLFDVWSGTETTRGALVFSEHETDFFFFFPPFSVTHKLIKLSVFMHICPSIPSIQKVFTPHSHFVPDAFLSMHSLNTSLEKHLYTPACSCNHPIIQPTMLCVHSPDAGRLV